MQEVFREVQARFLPAFHRALPELSQVDLLWRIHFLIGAMCSLLADPPRLKQLTGGLCDTNDPEETLGQLLAFGAAGLRASPSGEAPRPLREGSA